MSRDKLLTIRIEEEKRLAFNNWCEARDYSYSKFLYKVIEGCLSGRIDESIFSGEPVDNDLAVCLSDRMKHIEQLVTDSSINLKVDDSVDEYLANNLDKRIEESVTKKLDSNLDEKIDKHLDDKLDEAIADKIKNLEDKIEPLLAAEQDASKLANDEKFINAVATEVKK